MQDIERNIRSMQNDMTKLNTLITKESGLREALQQGTVLMESDFIQALKVKEHLSKNILYNALSEANTLINFYILCLALPFPAQAIKLCPVNLANKTLSVCACSCSLFDCLKSWKCQEKYCQKRRQRICRVPIARDILARVLLG